MSTVDCFSNDISTIGRLSPEDEAKLGILVARGRSASCTIRQEGRPFERERLQWWRVVGGWASSRLASANLRLAFTIAARYYYSQRVPGTTLADLIQEANMAMVAASRSFDPRQGRFGAYAAVCIENALSALGQKASPDSDHDVSFETPDGRMLLETIAGDSTEWDTEWDTEGDAERDIYSIRTLFEVYHHLLRLPRQVALMLLLRYAGFSHKEIGNLCGLPPETVRARAKYGLRRMRIWSQNPLYSY